MTQWQKTTQIKCDSINLISEQLINQSFVSSEEEKDNTPMENAKIKTHENESFILDILKGVGMEAPTLQKKKKRKQNKNKKLIKRSSDKRRRRESEIKIKIKSKRSIVNNKVDQLVTMNNVSHLNMYIVIK